MTSILLRGFIYLLVAAAVSEVLFLEARTLPAERMYSEFGYAEWLQSLFLFLSVALLAYHARRAERWRALVNCMALAFGILLVRENDQVMELFLPHGSWKYLAGLLAAWAAVYFWRHRSAVAAQLNAYAATASFGVMIAGFVVMVFSRLFGRGDYWKTVMDEGYLRLVKNAVEEGVELLAITLIWVAVVELVFFTANEDS
jgi:hypothetical protein